MEKTSFSHHVPLTTDPTKRIESVVAVCIGMGYVNRHVLANYYGLTQLQASKLLREFLQAHIQDVRRDAKRDGYVLLGYPKKSDTKEHRHTHCG